MKILVTNPNDNLDCSDMEVAMGQELRHRLRKWLGEDGISFFRKVKEKYGRVDACWVEGDFDDGSENMTELRKALHQCRHPSIPHSVHFREGMQVRNFLRTIFGDTWTAHDYDNRWATLVEEAIETS